jgi:hypothetical protein
MGMAMSEQKPDDREIHRILVELHDELERAQPLDEDERAMLRHMMGDIREVLDRSDAEVVIRYRPNETLTERLRQAVDHFEVTNPDLTMVIKKALDTLSIAGI